MLFQEILGDLQALYEDALPSPGEAAQSEESRSEVVALVMAEEGAADDGERARSRFDGEVQLVDDRPDERSRTEDLDLGVGGALVAEHRREIVEAGDGLRLVLDLEEHVGVVGRSNEDAIRGAEEERRDGRQDDESA